MQQYYAGQWAGHTHLLRNNRVNQGYIALSRYHSTKNHQHHRNAFAFQHIHSRYLHDDKRKHAKRYEGLGLGLAADWLR